MTIINIMQVSVECSGVTLVGINTPAEPGDFDEWVLSILLVKIKASIFDFNSSSRLGREINLYQRGEWRSKEGDGRGKRNRNHTVFSSSVTEWLCIQILVYSYFYKHKWCRITNSLYIIPCCYSGVVWGGTLLIRFHSVPQENHLYKENKKWNN